MLILSRNLHGGSVPAVELSFKYNTHVVPAEAGNHREAARASAHRHQQVDQRIRCWFYNPVHQFTRKEIENNFIHADIKQQC
jgi:hypothetical protein